MSYTAYKSFEQTIQAGKKEQKIVEDLKKRFDWTEIIRELEREDEEERTRRARDFYNYEETLYNSLRPTPIATTQEPLPFGNIGVEFTWSRTVPQAQPADDAEDVIFDDTL